MHEGIRIKVARPKFHTHATTRNRRTGYLWPLSGFLNIASQCLPFTKHPGMAADHLPHHADQGWLNRRVQSGLLTAESLIHR